MLWVLDWRPGRRFAEDGSACEFWGMSSHTWSHWDSIADVGGW